MHESINAHQSLVLNSLAVQPAMYMNRAGSRDQRKPSSKERQIVAVGSWTDMHRNSSGPKGQDSRADIYGISINTHQQLLYMGDFLITGVCLLINYCEGARWYLSKEHQFIPQGLLQLQFSQMSHGIFLCVCTNITAVGLKSHTHTHTLMQFYFSSCGEEEQYYCSHSILL